MSVSIRVTVALKFTCQEDQMLIIEQMLIIRVEIHICRVEIHICIVEIFVELRFVIILPFS
jgi:hypothetical protein